MATSTWQMHRESSSSFLDETTKREREGGREGGRERGRERKQDSEGIHSSPTEVVCRCV